MDKNSNLAQKICNVYFAIAIDVESVIVGSTNMHRNVTFKTGKDWERIEFTLGTAKYVEPQKHSTYGEIYQGKLNLFYPGEDTDTLDNFETIKGLPILIKIVYGSGQQKLMGTKDNPVKLKENFSVNAKTGNQLTFTRTGERAYWLD